MAVLDRLGSFHQRVLHPARVERLLDAIAPHVPATASTLLDVGCGDGRLAHAVAERHGNLASQGIDVLLRSEVVIPVQRYDGAVFPLADRSVDVTIVVDVLHHADDPAAVLAECARVTSQCVIVKDHVAENMLDNTVLKAMDWVGNRHTGVALPYRYPTAQQWHTMFAAAGLAERTWSRDVRVYAPPVSWVAGRDLHLLAVLTPVV